MSDETTHQSPIEGQGYTPCCGRTPFELPRTDRITADPKLVTCLGMEANGQAVPREAFPDLAAGFVRHRPEPCGVVPVLPFPEGGALSDAMRDAMRNAVTNACVMLTPALAHQDDRLTGEALLESLRQAAEHIERLEAQRARDIATLDRALVVADTLGCGIVVWLGEPLKAEPSRFAEPGKAYVLRTAALETMVPKRTDWSTPYASPTRPWWAEPEVRP